MNIKDLRKETKKWQKKLGLTPWSITIQWATPEDLGHTDTEKVFGLNSFDPNHMESHIKMLNPKYDDYDVLGTMIHELLHLHMFPLEAAAGYSIKPPSDQWETAMEQTINRLSILLREGNNGRQSDSSGDSARSTNPHPQG
jgi:hypothetical protein